MSSRERRDGADSMDLLIRQSLREQAGGKLPRPAARRGLLARAARQQGRYALRLPGVITGLLKPEHAPFAHHATQNQMPYLEAFFGPRLGGFSFNQLMR